MIICQVKKNLTIGIARSKDEIDYIKKMKKLQECKPGEIAYFTNDKMK